MKLKSVLFLCLISFLVKAQTIVTIDNGTWVNLQSNTVLVIDQTNSSIQKTGTSGGILTDFESSRVILHIGDSTGTFTIPFVSSVGNTIPFSYNITTAGIGNGKYSFSSYETSDVNTPLPSVVTTLSPTSDLLIDRFWIAEPIDYTQEPTGQYVFNYDDNDLVGNTISELDFIGQFWGTSSWNSTATISSINTTTNTVTMNVTSSTQFPIWTLASISTPLPISLLYFNANCKDNLFEWATASETNNSMFIIEGTNDGFEFTSLDTITCAGNSNATINYLRPINERYSYYRLKQIDYDGQSVTYSLIMGCGNLNTPISLFPNPNNGVFNINHNSMYLFELFDLTGKQIWSEKTNKTNFDLSNIPSGCYLIKLSNDKTNKTIKFIKTN